MASITKLGKGKQPPRAVDFVYPEGKRNRVRLGVVSHDTAEECCRQIEKLIESRSTNQAPSLPTLRTVREITVGCRSGIWYEEVGLMVFPTGREAKDGCGCIGD